MNQLDLWGISLVSSGTVVRDSSRGTGQGDCGACCCGERFKSPGSRARLYFFSCRLDEMTGFAKKENMYKRGAGMLACVRSTCHTKKIWRRTPVLKRLFETRILKVERVGFRNENRTSSTQNCEKTLTLNRAPLFTHKSRRRSRTFAIQVIILSIFFTCLSLTNLLMA